MNMVQIVTSHNDDSQTVIGWELGDDESAAGRAELEQVLGPPHYQVIIPGRLKP